MGINYEKLSATASRLIGDNGKEVTLKVESTTYDPVTGGTTGTESEPVISAVVLPYREGSGLIADSVTYTEALSVIIDGDVAIEPTDKLVESGNTYTIESFKRINPNDGNPIIYKLVMVR